MDQQTFTAVIQIWLIIQAQLSDKVSYSQNVHNVMADQIMFNFQRSTMMSEYFWKVSVVQVHIAYIDNILITGLICSCVSATSTTATASY